MPATRTPTEDKLTKQRAHKQKPSKPEPSQADNSMGSSLSERARPYRLLFQLSGLCTLSYCNPSLTTPFLPAAHPQVQPIGFRSHFLHPPSLTVSSCVLSPRQPLNGGGGAEGTAERSEGGRRRVRVEGVGDFGRGLHSLYQLS